MSHQCHQGECSSTQSHSCCNCCQGRGSCCTCNCHQAQSSCHDQSSCDFPQMLLKMADDAWMELLKEKIKEQIEASSGKQLDGLAKLVANANKEKWKFRLAGHKTLSDYKEKIMSFFSHEK